MQELSPKNKELLIKLNVEELTPAQVRLIKGVNSLMAHVLIAEEESEYFDAASELLKKAAELIKEAQFSTKHKDMNYGEQAVEFAVDFLNEAMNEGKLGSIDN